MWIAYEPTYDECRKYCFQPAVTKYFEGVDLRSCMTDKFNKFDVHARARTHTHILCCYYYYYYYYYYFILEVVPPSAS